MLEIVNLSKRYEKPLFEDINFTLRKGELITVVGLSGSGKSTLLRVITGLDQPDSGQVLIDGRPTSSQFGRILLVFQNYALWPHMTVLQNVVFPLLNKGFDKHHAEAKARATLSLLQISQLESRYPNQISGGQQQRVALARALAFEPDFILFDEPFANLDPQLRRTAVVDIRSLLETLNIGAILVTHNIDDAMEFSSKVAVLHGGVFYPPSDFDSFYFCPPNLDVASIFGPTTFVKTDDEIIATRPEFIRVLKNGPYRVEACNHRKNHTIVRLIRDQVRTLVELPEKNSWLTEGLNVGLEVPEQYVFERKKVR